MSEIGADVGLFGFELEPVSAVTKAVAGRAGDLTLSHLILAML